MKNSKDPIISECPLFVCRECHTKTGHPHQKWCSLSETDNTECDCCIYWQRSRKICGHPYKKKGGNAK